MDRELDQHLCGYDDLGLDLSDDELEELDREDDGGDGGDEDLEWTPEGYRLVGRTSDLGRVGVDGFRRTSSRRLSPAERRLQWSEIRRPDGAVAEFAENGPGGYLEGRAPSGAQPGRPVVGTRKSASAEQLLADFAGRDISELRGALKRGKPSAAAKELRTVVAVAVARLRADRKATPDALAEALGCDRRTIARLCRQAEDPAA